jgi:hypothetical protein
MDPLRPHELSHLGSGSLPSIVSVHNSCEVISNKLVDGRIPLESVLARLKEKILLNS